MSRHKKEEKDRGYPHPHPGAHQELLASAETIAKLENVTRRLEDLILDLEREVEREQQSEYPYEAQEDEAWDGHERRNK